MAADIPGLQPHLLLGLRTDIKDNVHFVTDDDIVYPAGTVVTVHNFLSKTQKYIKLANKGNNLTHIKISPNKKILAVLESADDGKLPVITLWCMLTYRKRKTLLLPTDQDINATRFVNGAFSNDSKNFIAITDKPDWGLYCFKCDKGKLESRGKANNPNNTGSVNDIACNPTDVNQLALVGDSLLRVLACSDYNWRQFGYSKAEGIILTSCCWLSQERLMVGSQTGRILILENGELRAVFEADTLSTVDLKTQEEGAGPSEQSLSITTENVETISEDRSISHIISFSRGFAYSYRPGRVHVFEKENPNKFTKRAIYNIPKLQIAPENEYGEVINLDDMCLINTFTINPVNDRLIATCGYSQLYTIRLWMQDQDNTFIEYGYHLHFGPIGSMSICRWKPWVATSGLMDHTLKLWNYDTDELQLEQRFEDDVYGIGMHPTGLYIAVGFTDKLRYMMVMIDEFIQTYEFSIRACRLISFSNLGHLFAAVNGNLIHIYSSITFEMLYLLKGHGSQITQISWNEKDGVLASSGRDGAVYEWDVDSSTRKTEYINKSNPFLGVSINHLTPGVYAIGSDGRLLQLNNSLIYREVAIAAKNVPLEAVVLSQLDNILFVAGNKGSIYSLKLPLLDMKTEMLEFSMQATEITQMCLTSDDKTLISGAKDGSLCIWKVVNAESKVKGRDNNFDAANEILISRQILEEKINSIKDLQMRMKELQNEHSYQMRQTQLLHEGKLKEIHTGYCAAIEELKDKNEQMETEHLQEVQNTNVEIAKIKSDNEQAIQRTEALYNEKLIYEYERYQRLEEKMSKMRRNYETELFELKAAKKKSEEEITVNFMNQLKDKDVLMDELREVIEKKTQEHEQIKALIEDDADREIYELKMTHAKENKDQQDQIVRLRGEATIAEKKLFAAQKEIDDLKHTVFGLENEHIKFKATIVSLEKDVADLKKDIQERDFTIEEKEKRIFYLKGKNSELEKIKFLLEYKIKELKSHLEPKQRKIQEQQQQITEMVNELETLQKVILNLDLHVADLKEKLNASDCEVKKEIDRNRRMKLELKTIRSDIHHASGFIQNIPMLIKSVKEMYHKYNADKDFMLTQAEDIEAKNEFLRQRHFLEKTVYCLNEQAAKNTNSLSSDKVRLVQENSALLVETNALRKQLKEEMATNRKFESILGMSKKVSLMPKVIQQKVDLANLTKEEITQQYENILRQNEHCIEAMTEDNVYLRQELRKCRRENEQAEADATNPVPIINMETTIKK